VSNESRRRTRHEPLRRIHLVSSAAWASALGSLWVLAVTILRALRAPNDYSEAHWLIGYQYGFFKRGLPGFLLSPFVTPQNGEATIAAISTFWLGLLYVSIAWMCYRVVRAAGPRPGRTLAALTFLTSPYIVMSAHLNGYYDNLLVLGSLLAVLLVMRGWIGTAALVMTVGTLVHESVILVGLPNVVLAAAMFHPAQEVSHPSWKTIRRRLLPFALPLLSFAAILVHQEFFLDRPSMEARLTAHLSQFDFIKEGRQDGTPRALATPFFDYLRSESAFFRDRLLDKPYLLGILPSLLVILLQPGGPFRRDRYGGLAFWALVAIVLAPLLLLLIAGDTSRIWTYPLIVCFLGSWTASELNGSTEVRKPLDTVFGLVCIAVILHNVFLQTPLMDGLAERFTDAERVWLYLPALVVVLVSSLVTDWANRTGRPVEAAHGGTGLGSGSARQQS
jgi:hypothetical protein